MPPVATGDQSTTAFSVDLHSLIYECLNATTLRVGILLQLPKINIEGLGPRTSCIQVNCRDQLAIGHPMNDQTSRTLSTDRIRISLFVSTVKVLIIVLCHIRFLCINKCPNYLNPHLLPKIY